MTRRTHREILHPRLPAVLEPRIWTPESLSDNARCAESVIEDLSLPRVVAAGVEMEQVVLRRIDLSHSELPKLELTDVVFDHCNVANGRWPESIAHRTRWIESRITGLDASASTFKDATFEDCALDLCNLRFASFKRTVFRRCTIREGDFGNADLAGVRFDACRLEGAQFSQAKLAGADFRGSEIDGVGWAPEDVRGVVIDASQVTGLGWTLMRRLGVVIRDKDDG